RDPGDYGRLFAERFGFCETNTVVRQHISWQRECSALLNDYQILEGLKPYYDQGHFKWCEGVSQVHHALAQDYVKDLMENPQGTRIALAYKNTEVYDINQAIRQVLKEQGYLKESFTIQGDEYALGDRIRFTQNDNHGQYIHNINESSFPLSLLLWKTQGQKQGVKNGSFGTIESFNEKKLLLTVALEDKRRVHFNIDEYPHIAHGYAMGIHKSESSTFDKSFVSLDPLMDPATLLVAMTRHRQDVQAYVNREQFIDFKDVVEQLSRLSHKETLQDYAVSEEQKPYFTRIQQYRDLMIEAGTLREEMEGELDVKTPLYKHSSYVAYQTCFQEKKRVAEEILTDWKNHAPYTRLAGLRKDILEVEAGIRPRLLSDLEYRASIQVQGYMDLVKETRTLWHTISQTHLGALARSHTLYEDYASKKTERDSLASVFQENLKLYMPFLKTTQDEGGDLKDYWGECVDPENRVYLSALKSHAEAHKRSQLQNLYYERLPQDQKAHYDTVKAYVTTRNEAAVVYSHLQNKAEESVQVTSPESFISLDRFHALQAQRDALALKIIDSPEKYQSFFDLLNIKEDKLLEHAVAGEVREKVQAYGAETDVAKRASQAQELTRILSTSKEYRIFKESGLDFHRLTFDIAFYDKVTKGEISPTVHPDQIYRPIAEYLKASHESARLWKIIQVRTREDVSTNQKKDLAFQEQNVGTTHETFLQKQGQELTSTPFSSSEIILALEKFHELRLKREDLASKIIEAPEKVQDFLEALKINEDKLLEQAISKEIREKIQVYFKEEDTDQRLSQAQDLKKMLINTSRYQYQLFKESGLDQNRLNFDAIFYEKLNSGELHPQARPDHIYEPIQDYLEASKDAFLLWKKAEQQTHEETVHALKKDRQLALTARNESACLLANDQVSLSIVSSMRQGIQRHILQQAGVIENESHRVEKTRKNPSLQSTSYSQSSPQSLYSVPSFISIEQVRAAARRNMTSLAIDLLGEPNKHMGTKATLRFGTKGSLVVNIAGNREGLWNDFETGEKGDIVSLVQREKNLDFKEAISYLADVLNVRSHQGISQHKVSPRPQQHLTAQETLEQIKENAMRLNAVSEFNLKSKPIGGTLAETYLQKERNIKGPLSPDLRYIPKGTTFMYQGERRTIQHHCLAAFGRNQEERLSSVQLTKLDDQGKRALAQTGEKLNKIHYGIAKGSFVLLQEDKTTNRVFMAEGIETALSLKEAGIKGKIIASMGIYNMTNYQGTEKEIIICADNDEHKPQSQTYKTIEKTRNYFQTQGKSVSIIKPIQPGDDFNDVLKKQGPIGVKKYVKPYLNLEKENTQGSLSSKETDLVQKATLDPKLSESLNRMPSSSIPSLSSSIDKPKPNPIEAVSQYLESLLRKIKNFEGCSLADEAKQELKTYMQILQKNEITLQALKSYNPDLAQETHLFMQRQMNSKSKGMER
ncbi:MAG: toprim domain-containing protein, partial [Alphaproteobacteria bacterium]|nr:toprim domain-containing protein [Alphaproteobacteria bacterium]